MKRLTLSLALFAASIGIAHAQSNPGFNPDLNWCATQGSIAIRGAAKWQCLLPGTAGQSLLSGGPGANPYWNTITGTGTVTSVNGSGGTTGLTLTGGPITGAGTLTLGGTLALANGGTGGVGAANTVLRSNGTANSFGQIVNGDITAGTITNAAINANAAIAPSKFATQGALTVLANITGGSAVPTTPTVTALLDAAFSSTQGTTLYRNVSGWSALPPGSTGQFLQTGGPAANPAWATVTGGSIGSIPNNTVIANISGSSASPTSPTVSQLLDSALSSTQGTVIYRGASNWQTLATGTSGALLKTNGAAADPTWTTLGQIKGEPSNTLASAGNIGEEIVSNIAQGSAVTVATGLGGVNITSITLTAGDWDISAQGYCNSTASTTVTAWYISISTVSATGNSNSPLYAVTGDITTTSTVAHSLPISPARQTISSTTTYYLVAQSSATASSFCWGQLRARRMR